MNIKSVYTFERLLKEYAELTAKVKDLEDNLSLVIDSLENQPSQTSLRHLVTTSWATNNPSISVRLLSAELRDMHLAQDIVLKRRYVLAADQETPQRRKDNAAESAEEGEDNV